MITPGDGRPAASFILFVNSYHAGIWKATGKAERSFPQGMLQQNDGRRSGTNFRNMVIKMKIFTRVFIHGLDSSSRGTKESFFRERYTGM
jgi:hypothetical protein